jgi:hypothetical protein
MPVAVAVCTAVALAVVPVAVLAAEARLRFTRGLTSFRCRVRPASAPRRRARWRARTRAGWARDVLLVRSGPCHLGVTSFAVGLPRTATVRQLSPREVRGLGDHAVSLCFRTDEGRSVEVAVAGDCADRLVGPFLTVLLPDLPPAQRDMDP